MGNVMALTSNAFLYVTQNCLDIVTYRNVALLLQGQDPFKGIGEEELMANNDNLKLKEKKKILVHIDVYKAVLNEVRKNTPQICDYGEIFPNQPDAPVLTRAASKFNSTTTPSSLFFTNQKPNHCVCYLKDGQKKYGWVVHIYKLKYTNQTEYSCVVIQQLADVLEDVGISFSASFPGFLRDVLVVATLETSTYNVAPPQSVVNVCAYNHRLPAWSFGLHKPMLLLQPIDHEPLFPF
jgi:hypothetical protein